MEPSLFFQVSFIAIFSCLTAARLYYRLSTGAIRDGVFTRREGVFPVLLRWTLGLPLVYATVSFVFLSSGGILTDTGTWMYVSLPFVLRSIGVIVGFAAVTLIVLVHRELGIYFSSTLVIRPEHRLVTTGPYRFVRHPMYSSYLLLFIGAFLVSANWVIGASGTAVIATLMTVRLTREEALLIDRFGAEYEEYRRNTGMFIPMTHRIGDVRRLADDAS